jgi:hypothetical protein
VCYQARKPFTFLAWYPWHTNTWPFTFLTWYLWHTNTWPLTVYFPGLIPLTHKYMTFDSSLSWLDTSDTQIHVNGQKSCICVLEVSSQESEWSKVMYLCVRGIKPGKWMAVHFPGLIPLTHKYMTFDRSLSWLDTSNTQIHDLWPFTFLAWSQESEWSKVMYLCVRGIKPGKWMVKGHVFVC